MVDRFRVLHFGTLVVNFELEVCPENVERKINLKSITKVLEEPHEKFDNAFIVEFELVHRAY